MDVASATATTSTTTQTGSAASSVSDYQTFLNMLTTQLQYQDPLNPMESSDFAVQLATFSGVEQQTQTNLLLQSMISSFDMMGMAQLAGWIGNEARVAAPAWFDGAPVTISPNPAFGADGAVLVVRDAEGDVVSREDVPVIAGPMDWVGLDPTGAPLPGGAYSFTLESYAGEKLLGTSPVEVYGRIIEARGGESGTMLVLEGGIEVMAQAVTGLRAAQ